MNLQNKEIEKVLAETIEDIMNGIIDDNDEEIDQYLIPDFNKLQQEDQQIFISYIQEHYSDKNFIKHKIFQNQQLQNNENEIEQIENSKELFQRLINQKDWNQVINKLKDQDFCQENKIPNFWETDESVKLISNNKDILPKLLQLIEIYEYQQGYNYLNQILIWFQLLSYVYDNKEQNKSGIEKLVGASLEKQILQYLEYKEILQQIKPQEFQNLMEAIRQTQLKLSANYDFSQLDQYFQVCYIVQTRLIDKKYLDDYLRQLFQIQEQQINFQALENQVFKLVFSPNKIQELYIILLFYFLNQNCSLYDFQNDFAKLEQKLSSLTEVTQKEKFIKLHCNKQMNKPDSFYQFLLSQVICLDQQQSNNIFLEKCKNYREAQNECLQQLQQFELDVQKIFSLFHSDAITNLNLMKKVPLKTIYQIKPDEKIQTTILIYSLLQRENLQVVFELISSIQKFNLFECTQKLLEFKFDQEQSIIYLLILIGIIYDHPSKNLQYFMNLYQIDKKFSKAEFIQNFCDLLSFIQIDQKLELTALEPAIQKLSCSNDEWQIIDIIFNKEELADNYEQIFEFYLNPFIDQKNKQYLYQILQNFRKLNQFQSQQIKKPFQILIEILSQEDLIFQCYKLYQKQILLKQMYYQYIFNYQKQLEIFYLLKQAIFEETLKIIFQLLNSYQKLQQEILDFLNIKFQTKTFDFLQFKDLIQKGRNFNYIQCLLILQFYSSLSESLLIDKASFIFKNDPYTYQQLFECEQKQFNNIKITPDYLKNQQKFESLPKFANINLEDFNISLQEMSLEDKQKLVEDWFADTKNPNEFRKLIPLYFNVIKRKEHSNNLLSLLNKQGIQKIQAFNMKAMFQILYINSNNELKQMLLKLWSEINPLPFLFSNPNLDQVKTSQDIFCLNEKLIFVFPQCFPIINFSLSKKQNSYGKTSLINQIFYKSDIFEVSDNCKLNQNTIDIMFDFCFSGSRKLAIADIHGIIPMEVMIKILPLFKLWIIQMDTEDELQENYEQLLSIKQHLYKWNPECCFIIRNSQTKNNTKLSDLEITIKNKGISLHKIIDLTQKRS